jgi:type IX secretion system PorP/SprF family membrane protein
MKRLLYTFLISALGFTGLSAQQDYHFSQFFAAPITYNPSTAGAFESDFRAMLNYRNQYGAIANPYQTFAFAADAGIKLTKEAYDRNFLGVGLSVINDNAGVGGFNNFIISGSGSYAIDLGGTDANPHYLALGLQFGYNQRSLDLNAFSWETQWTGVSFNQSIASGESATGQFSEGNFTLGGGVSWFKSFGDASRLLVGGAVLHANAPQVDILGSNEALMRKYVGHASMVIVPNNDAVTLLPNAFVMFQGPNRIIDIGSEIEFRLWERTDFTDFRNNLSLNLGAYYRVQDAIYFIARANYYDFSLGISYDFTASQLAENNNGRGGVELVLSYRTSFSGPGTNRQKLIKSKGL